MSLVVLSSLAWAQANIPRTPEPRPEQPAAALTGTIAIDLDWLNQQNAILLDSIKLLKDLVSPTEFELYKTEEKTKTKDMDPSALLAYRNLYLKKLVMGATTR
jgi:hypothetical protein